MRLKIVLSFLLLFISTSAFSLQGPFPSAIDAYNACKSFAIAHGAYSNPYCDGNSLVPPYSNICNSTYGSLYIPNYSTPTKDYFVWCGSGAKPNCTLTNNTIDPNNSSQCVEPPHVCVVPEDPVLANCYFPEDQGEGVSCFDGSTVYPPSVCEPTPFDAHLPPTPGHPADCMGGNVAVYPQTCLDVYKMVIGVPPLDTMLGIVLGSKPMKAVSGAFDSLGRPVIRAAATIAKRSADYEPPRYANVEYDVPHAAVGSALQKAFSSQPTSAFTSGFLNAVNAGRSASQQFVSNVNTGQITRTGSTVPLSSNQIADMAVSSNFLTPDNLTALTPFVDSAQSPWLAPGIAALSQDYQRVYNPAGFQSPVFFPNIPAGSGSSPSSIASNDPVAVFTQSSPLNYTFPSETPSTLPDANVNQNPLGTDTQTTPYSAPDPNTAVDPSAALPPPIAPTIYPDTWKYFDFLPMSNPFHFDVGAFIPDLPEPTCYYEIHRTFNVPYLGTKHFDMAPCAPLQPLRTVLAWVFSILSLFTCFFVIFRSTV